jgi:hypothetical protein
MRIFYSSLLIFLYFLFPSLETFSQKKASMITETGSVIDASTNLPVEGASVNFYSGKQITATNEQGKFSVKLDIQAGDTLLVTVMRQKRSVTGIM